MWLQRVRAQSINLQHANQKSMGCYFKLLFVIITIMYEGVHVGGGCGGHCHSPGLKRDNLGFWAVHRRGERREKSEFVLNLGSNSVCKGNVAICFSEDNMKFIPWKLGLAGSWELLSVIRSSRNGGSRSPQHQQHIPKSPQPAPTAALTTPA